MGTRARKYIRSARGSAVKECSFNDRILPSIVTAAKENTASVVYTATTHMALTTPWICSMKAPGISITLYTEKVGQISC